MTTDTAMSSDRVIDMINDRIKEHGTAKAYAEHVGTSPVVISQIINGHVLPTGAVLRDLGLQRTVKRCITYQKA